MFNNIPTIRNFLKYSVNIYMLSLTEFFWDFQNNALWDTHQHALLGEANQHALLGEAIIKECNEQWQKTKLTAITLMRFSDTISRDNPSYNKQFIITEYC